MKMLDILENLRWGTMHFGGLVSSSNMPKRDIQLAVKKGFAKPLGLVSVCDDDGYILEPERLREGFAITDVGLIELSRLKGIK